MSAVLVRRWPLAGAKEVSHAMHADPALRACWRDRGARVPVRGAARARSDDAGHIDGDGDRSQRRGGAWRVVNATNIATNIGTSTNTNQEGTYTFTALPPGEYTVAVELAGFKRNVVTGVILQIAETSRLDIPLKWAP